MVGERNLERSELLKHAHLLRDFLSDLPAQGEQVAHVPECRQRLDHDSVEAVLLEKVREREATDTAARDRDVLISRHVARPHGLAVERGLGEASRT